MSVRSVIRHYARDGKVALLEATPRLIKDGIYLKTNREEDGTLSHIFAAKATIDGVPYAVGFVVREDRNGRRYYDHELKTLERLDRLNGQALKTEDGARRNLCRTSGRRDQTPVKESLSNILKKHLVVNSDVKKVF